MLDLNEIRRLVQSVNSAEFHDEMPTERELADAIVALIARAEQAGALEAERDAALERIADLTGPIDWQMLAERRYHEVEDAEAERDRLKAQVDAMTEAIHDHMNRPDYWDGLRAALAAQEREAKE